MDRVLSQVGHCGIWCGSCVVGNGALMELARRYLELADSHGLEHWGAAGFDYAEFSKALGAISELDVCPGCLAGGGRDDCEIRRCSVERAVETCVACGSFGECQHDELLEHMRTGALRAGLGVIDSPGDKERILSKPEADLARKWWWRALFEGEE